MILGKLREERAKFPCSDRTFGLKYELTSSDMSRVMRGGIIGDNKVVTVARLLGIDLKAGIVWKIVHTEAFGFIWEMFEQCRTRSVGRIICDSADIGKSVVIDEYVRKMENVYRVDCSLVKDRRQFIDAIATVLGIDTNKTLANLFMEITLMLKGMDKPLLILDEAGDLKDQAFLEIKALCNELGIGQKSGGACGLCLLGANGLETKLKRGVKNNKVGFEEVLSRLGGEVYRASPADEAEFAKYQRRAAEWILAENLPGAKLDEVLPGRGKISLRRLQENIVKAKMTKG